MREQPTLWGQRCMMRVAYPNGKVEYFDRISFKWRRSYFSKGKKFELLRSSHEFLGYL